MYIEIRSNKPGAYNCSCRKFKSIKIKMENNKVSGEVIKKLEEYIEKIGFKSVTIDVLRESNQGNHFFGYISKVIVHGTLSDGSKEVLNWILKTAPQSQMYRTMFNTPLAYEREAYVYEEVLPVYRQFETEKRVSQPFNQYPRFLLSYLQPLNESIVMENMKSIGYVMRNRQRPLDLNHVKLVLVAYAKLHALSYALKDQKPELFGKLAKNTEDVFSKLMKKDAYGSQEGIMNKALKSLDPEKDSRPLEMFEKYSKTYIDIQIQKCQETNQYSVIGHGDSWVNNMLWKYEDPDRSTYPTKVCILDWQLARYCSPACDLSYFLFTCTSKQFRDKHYDNMIQFYYYTLCAYLSELGSDPKKWLPFSILQDELRNFGVVGLYMTVLVLDVITKYNPNITDEKDDFEEEPITLLSHAERYKERVRDVIIDFYEKGYFNCE